MKVDAKVNHEFSLKKCGLLTVVVILFYGIFSCQFTAKCAKKDIILDRVGVGIFWGNNNNNNRDALVNFDTTPHAHYISQVSK